MLTRRGVEIFGARKIANCGCARFRNAHFAAGARSLSPHRNCKPACEAVVVWHCACVTHSGEEVGADVHHPPAHSVVDSASAQIRVMDVTKLRRMLLCLDASYRKTIHALTRYASPFVNTKTRRAVLENFVTLNLLRESIIGSCKAAFFDWRASALAVFAGTGRAYVRCTWPFCGSSGRGPAMMHSWERDFFFIAAIVVLIVHLLFNAWYVFGAAITRGRSRLAIVHIFSLIYGVIAENASFACPLTLLEQWCQARAGIAPYTGAFEVHYLRAFVAPQFPLWLLEYGAVGVFLINIAVYARRFALRHAAAHAHHHPAH